MLSWNQFYKVDGTFFAQALDSVRCLEPILKRRMKTAYTPGEWIMSLETE